MNDRTPTQHPEPPSDTETYYRDESKRWEDRAYEYANRLDAAEAECGELQARIDEALARLDRPTIWIPVSRARERTLVEVRSILSTPSKETS